MQGTEKGNGTETSMMMALTPRAENLCGSQRKAFQGSPIGDPNVKDLSEAYSCLQHLIVSVVGLE